jgi:hypothetical protein
MIRRARSPLSCPADGKASPCARKVTPGARKVTLFPHKVTLSRRKVTLALHKVTLFRRKVTHSGPGKALSPQDRVNCVNLCHLVQAAAAHSTSATPSRLARSLSIAWALS